MPRVSVMGLGDFGVIKDIAPHLLARNAWSDANNVRFLPGGAHSLQSQRSVFSSAAFNPLWVKAFPPNTSPIWVYASNSLISCYKEGTGHAALRTGMAAADERWQGFVFQGLGLF